MTLAKALRPWLVVAVLVLVSGCAVKLVPDYDKALVSGLTASNTGIMQLFAATDSGTKHETFSHREDKYNTLIGNMDALRIQAQARPVPDNRITEAVNKLLQGRNSPKLPDELPSAFALTKISEILVKMRDTDKKQGVTRGEVQAFKNNVVIYLDQALTYESFIER